MYPGKDFFIGCQLAEDKGNMLFVFLGILKGMDHEFTEFGGQSG